MYLNPPITGKTSVTQSVVARDYQGIGLASFIYDKIEKDLKVFGAKLQPQYGALSPDAIKFWRRRKPKDLKLQILLNRDQREQGDRFKERENRDRSEDWNGEWVGEDRH